MTTEPTYRLALTAEQRKTLLLVCDALLMMMFSDDNKLDTPVLSKMIDSARKALEEAPRDWESLAS